MGLAPPASARRRLARAAVAALVAAVALALAGSALAAPNPPKGVKATGFDGSVKLKWYPSQEPAVVGYNVYRSTSTPVHTNGTPLNGSSPLTTTELIDTSVSDGVLYYYVVTAVNRNGVQSAASATVSARPLGSPSVRLGTVSPSNGSQGASRDTAVTVEVVLPNVGGGIDTSTLSSASVYLVPASDTTHKVPARVNTDGAGGVIVLQPDSCLRASTKYKFYVKPKLHDVYGMKFSGYVSAFTTGNAGNCGTTTQQFDKTVVATGNATGDMYTSLTFGPGHNLYAGTLGGAIVRWPVNANGTLGTAQRITVLGATQVVGLAFEPGSTVSNPKLWVTHSAPDFDDAPDWSGKITLLTGSGLTGGSGGVVARDMVTGLPRSIRDHETNSLAFDPSGNFLFVSQGSNSATGAPDPIWGNRPEHLLNAAILKVDYKSLESGAIQTPVDVRTGAVEGTGDPGSYNPYAAGAPVKLYATGLRNAFDLVFDSNGALYLPTNGSAAGGNTPAGTPGQACPLKGNYSGPAVPALTNLAEPQHDFLFRIDPGATSGSYAPGGYYGHPDAARCQFVLGSGNPGAGNAFPAAKVKEYPSGTQADPNYRGYVYDFGLHYSPDGALEYRSSTAFNGFFHGKLFICRYSAGDDILVLTPRADRSIDPNATYAGITGLTDFDNPLDIVEDPSNNYATGNLYVSELDPAASPAVERITLLKPHTP